MRTLFGYCLLIVGIGAFAGCGGSSPATSKSAPVSLSPAADLSESDCLEFSSRMEAAIRSGDLDEINGTLFDWDLCFDLSMQGVDVPEKHRAEARRGFLSSARDGKGLFHELNEQIRHGGTYTFLRLREIDNQKRMQFRMVLPNGGVNYHEFVLTRNAAGELRACDAYIYMSGERLSETMRRMFLQLAAHQNRSLIDRLAGREQLLVQNFDKVQQIPQHIRNGNLEAALSVHDSLPLELQKEKFILMLALRASQESGNDSRYRTVMENFRNWHPNDPAMNFISIDYFILQTRYAEALQALDALEKSVGGDPFLGITRAGIHVASMDYEKARTALDKAIGEDPGLEDAYWTHVTISLQTSDYNQTLHWLKKIEERFEVDWNQTLNNPAYAEFRRSPQYQQWQTHLNSRAL